MKKVSSDVEYIDHMGTDLTVVNAARVSFAKDATSDYPRDEWVFTKFHTKIPKLLKKDISLIRYLALHDHWTPFGHAQIQLRIKAPVFVARQLVKHCVGAVWNEESRRYIDSEPEFYDMPVLRKAAKNKKQGSTDTEVDITPIYDMEDIDGNCVLLPKEIEDESLETYKALIGLEVAPEQARAYLPQSVMVNWYWTGSLAFFIRVMQLRCKADAQKETREVADKISEIIKSLFPVTWYFYTNKYEIQKTQAILEFLKDWNSTTASAEIQSKLEEIEHKYNTLYNPDSSILY